MKLILLSRDLRIKIQKLKKVTKKQQIIIKDSKFMKNT